MKQGEENFEVVKEDDDTKRNYIFQKDGITKSGFLFIVAVLILLILAVVFIPKLMN